MWDAGMMNDRMLILEAEKFISSLRRDQYYLHSLAVYLFCTLVSTKALYTMREGFRVKPLILEQANPWKLHFSHNLFAFLINRIAVRGLNEMMVL